MNSRPFRFSLIFYILSALSMLLVLTWVLLSLISFKTAENDLYAQKGEEGRVLLAAIVELLPRPPAPPEVGSPAERYLSLIGAEKDFAGLLVTDAAGRVVYALGDAAEPDAALLAAWRQGKAGWQLTRDGRHLRRYAPIENNGRTIGAARLTLSLAAEQERLKSSRHLFLSYFLLDFLFLLAVGSYLLSHSVLLPIRRLLTATERIAQGDLEGAVHVPGSKEVAELADSFNVMVHALREKRTEVEETVASLRKANEELSAAREETIRSEKMASVGLLAAGMAHEIGTPLAAIMGYTAFLQEEIAAGSEQGDYLRRISEELRRIDRIVRGLLDYARVKQALQEEVDPVALLWKVAELLESQGMLKHLDVTVVGEPGVLRLQADPHLMEQIVLNLVLNAKDAMPHGGSLTLRGGLDGGEVVLEVADTGTGIAPDELKRIFDPFYTTKEPGKGTGLGLAIAARLAESCGARITVESTLGKGSRFSVRMPISR